MTYAIKPRTGWPSGAFPDRTVLVNFHSSSTNRYTKIFEFKATCIINAFEGYNIRILDSPDPTLTFPVELMNIPKGDRINVGLQTVYSIPQVWVYVADLKLPYLITNFLDNKTAVADTRQLITGIPPSYGPQGQSMIYECRFVQVGISPMFYGSWIGGVTREANSEDSYSATVISKFEVTSFGGVVVTVPPMTYLRMQYRNESTNNRWLDVDNPDVLGGESGLLINPCDENGYVHYIVKGLLADTDYTAFVSNVTPTSNLVKLIQSGDTSSIYFKNARTALPQPMTIPRFKTPPSDSSKRPIRILTGSCVDGSMEALDTLDQINFDFAVWNGDNYYQDNGTTYQDFIRRYDSLFRNEYYWRSIMSQTNYFNADDHEVEDNWDTKIQFTSDNVANFQLTPIENTLYNGITANPANVPYIIWTRNGATGQQPIQLSSNSRIRQAFDAFDRALPTMPYNKDHITRSYKESWGQVEAIFVNSKPYLYENNDVEYFKRHVLVHPDGTKEVLPGPNQYIPGPSLEFLKKSLIEAGSRIKVVFLSVHLATVYSKFKPEIREKFIQMARLTDPVVPLETINSLFDKLFLVREADRADAYAEQVAEFLEWIKKKGITNVFFMTGNPHNTTIEYLNKENCIVEICSSSFGNYRSNAYDSQFFGDPSDPKWILNVSQNTYADILVDGQGEGLVKVRVGFADKDEAVVDIKLAKNKNCCSRPCHKRCSKRCGDN